MDDTDRALVDPQVLCCLSADYVEIIQRLLDAGATRAESINRWGERPEGMRVCRVPPSRRCSGRTFPNGTTHREREGSRGRGDRQRAASSVPMVAACGSSTTGTL
jgi:hypothetical protein